MTARRTQHTATITIVEPPSSFGGSVVVVSGTELLQRLTILVRGSDDAFDPFDVLFDPFASSSSSSMTSSTSSQSSPLPSPSSTENVPSLCSATGVGVGGTAVGGTGVG